MSAVPSLVPDWSASAENSLATKQYYCLEYSAADQVDVCDGATDQVIGVLQNDPAAGEEATVRSFGITKVVSDGNAAAIVVGDLLGTNATGKAVKKTTDTDKLCGLALDASTADGTVIRMLLTIGAQLAG